jgi:hypothetical protein
MSSAFFAATIRAERRGRHTRSAKSALRWQVVRSLLSFIEPPKIEASFMKVFLYQGNFSQARRVRLGFRVYGVFRGGDVIHRRRND